ncbi:MAG TPA: hypothetical protein DCE42_05260 [Myxococcales bacterium]|nr:hypothetical protein [Deltaproteobacteria bacterium]MBK07344.1 hypothetical protein [Deltaproteobacteria bacterium]MBU53531.1 hypothetical protein [Deltaproteobacteria bacterium]HAA54140.1 hypothetical protein [Myxococcales bacterium]
MSNLEIETLVEVVISITSDTRKEVGDRAQLLKTFLELQEHAFVMIVMIMMYIGSDQLRAKDFAQDLRKQYETKKIAISRVIAKTPVLPEWLPPGLQKSMRAKDRLKKMFDSASSIIKAKN